MKVLSFTSNVLPALKKVLIVGAVTTMASLTTLSSQALPIQGQLEFFGIAASVYDDDELTGIDFGNINLNDFSASLPDGDVSPSNGVVTLATGDFAGAFGFFSPIGLNDFSFADLNPAKVLWTGGGFDFFLESVSVTDVGGANTDLLGSGYITHEAYSATLYNWYYSSTTRLFSAVVSAAGDAFEGPGPNLQITPVPEPATVVILMSGLLGLVVSRRYS